MSRHIHQRPPGTNLTFLQGQSIEACLDRKMNEPSSNCKQAHRSHLKEALGLSCFRNICFTRTCRGLYVVVLYELKTAKICHYPFHMEWSLQGLFLTKTFVNMKRFFREFIHTGKSTSTSAILNVLSMRSFSAVKPNLGVRSAL